MIQDFKVYQKMDSDGVSGRMTPRNIQEAFPGLPSNIDGATIFTQFYRSYSQMIFYKGTFWRKRFWGFCDINCCGKVCTDTWCFLRDSEKNSQFKLANQKPLPMFFFVGDSYYKTDLRGRSSNSNRVRSGARKFIYVFKRVWQRLQRKPEWLTRTCWCAPLQT